MSTVLKPQARALQVISMNTTIAPSITTSHFLPKEAGVTCPQSHLAQIHPQMTVSSLSTNWSQWPSTYHSGTGPKKRRVTQERPELSKTSPQFPRHWGAKEICQRGEERRREGRGGEGGEEGRRSQLTCKDRKTK